MAVEVGVVEATRNVRVPSCFPLRTLRSEEQTAKLLATAPSGRMEAGRWAAVLCDAEEVTDAAVETMSVCRPDRCVRREFGIDVPLSPPAVGGCSRSKPA
jgi:hypothetical protein